MVEREIIWTNTAAIQFQNIILYWNNRNKSNIYSQKLISIIDNKINFIANNPSSFKNADFLNTRICVFGYYSIYFKIIKNTIIITALWDNRQDPKKLLKLLKK